jgi:hypothetical protein
MPQLWVEPTSLYRFIMSTAAEVPPVVTGTKPLPSTKEVFSVLLSRPLVKVKLLFLVASFLSLLLSVGLYFNGHEQQGIYVGIWVPSILALGALLLAGESVTAP